MIYPFFSTAQRRSGWPMNHRMNRQLVIKAVLLALRQKENKAPDVMQ